MGGTKRWLFVAAWTWGCGPVVAIDASDGTTSTGEPGATASDPATLTAATSLPPGSEQSTTASDSLGDDPSLGGGEFDVFYDPTGSSCSQVFEVLPLPAAIAVLVDDSQSMATHTLDHDADPETPEITRWKLVADTLAVHVPELVELGLVELVAFPSTGAEAPPLFTACENEGPYGNFSDDADALLATLPAADATFLQGATPTAAAITAATLGLGGFNPAARKSIVVLTDGAPNCGLGSEPPALFDEIDAAAAVRVAIARAQDVVTHVIAIDVPEGVVDGSSDGDAVGDHREALGVLAEAGGTELHVASDPGDLDVALQQIERAATSCRLHVPTELAGAWYSVYVGREYYEELYSAEDCAQHTGFWKLPLHDGEVVELCGGACEALRQQGSALLEENCVFPE